MKISSTDAQRSQHAAPSAAARFCMWLARTKPGERLVYCRGLLAIDRIKGTSALNDSERRKLAAVGDHALALSDQGRLHLLQKRHGDRDYPYRAVAKASVPGRPA